MNWSRVIILILFISLSALPAYGLVGEHLNEQEIARVRDAQAIDKRTAVFIRIAERRLNVLTGASEPSAKTPVKKDKKQEKQEKQEKLENPDIDDYGPAPTGTLTELLQNYTGVMAELLDKLDDTYEKKKKDPNLAKAMEKLLDAGQSHLARLEQLRPKLTSSGEETVLEKAMEIVKMAIDGARGFKTQ